MPRFVINLHLANKLRAVCVKLIHRLQQKQPLDWLNRLAIDMLVEPSVHDVTV
jgi:hypothetical protein